MAAIILDLRVDKELAGELRKASRGREILSGKNSMGMETLNSETASLRSIDTGREQRFWLYFFRSSFFFLLNRNLRCPVRISDWFILCEVNAVDRTVLDANHETVDGVVLHTIIFQIKWTFPHVYVYISLYIHLMH